MPTTVYMAIYNPLDVRDPKHWALYLKNSQKISIILQVSDDKDGVGYYVEKPVYDKKPERSRHHDTSIAVGTIRTEDHDEAVSMIQETPVDNVSETWNCQAWAIEALTELENLGLFTWSTRGKEAVIARREHRQ